MRMKAVARSLAIVTLAAAGIAGLPAHAASPADPNKVIRPVFEANDDGFDIIRTNNNLYSSWVGQAIFEPLLTYDYLARPVRLRPLTAEALPEITDDGKTYTFRIRKGIHFQQDAAFKGKKRELTAADYAYTLKRIMDPKNRAVQSNYFEGKFVGMDALVEEAKKTDKFDYDKAIPGLEVVDRYTLRIRLTEADPNFSFLMADINTGAVAREVVEHYKDNLSLHPVGTGAYMLKKYVPQNKIILEANPDYRGFTWDFESTGDPWDEQLVKDMKGKKMPQIGRIEISIIMEEQSRWLAFDSGQIDYDWVPPGAVPKVIEGDKLKQTYRDRGFQLYRFVNSDITYTYFNMKDPVIGGYTKEKLALRRALMMSHLLDDEINAIRHGQAVKAEQPVPPGIIGYNPDYRSSIVKSTDMANKLLDKFGYKKGPDGYRMTPDGKPLVLKYATQASSLQQQLNEVWKRSLDRIGIKVDFAVSSFADNLKAASRCELMMWSLGGNASMPDAVNFLEGNYGPNAYKGNYGCYQSEAYDRMYEKIKLMPHGPERQAILNKMYRLLEFDGVQNLHVHRIRPWLLQPWVKGFKKHPVFHGDWMYLDIVKK